MAEHFEQSTLDPLTHHMLPATGFFMHLLPLQADHVDQQTFGQSMTTHHPRRHGIALFSEFKMSIVLHPQQSVTLHPCHRLADCGAALMQPLRNPGPERRDPFFD